MLSAVSLQAQREELLHHALSAARMGLWTWDLAEDRVTWSGACRDILGLPGDAGALDGESLFAGVHPDDRSRIRAQVAQCVGDGRPFDAEYRVVRADSQERWVAVHVQVVPDAQGAPGRLLGAVRDVSEEHRAREAQADHAERLQALWAAEERLRLAVETTETGLWTWDLATGAVTWTAQCFRIHGMKPGEFDGTGEQFFRLVHPDDRVRVDAAVRSAIGERRLYECEFRILRPDGAVAWVANRGRARYDAEGRPVSVLGTILDISERKASEQRLQVALEASRTGTFRWDIRTDELWWDTALDKLFGLLPGQAVHSLAQFIALVHPDDREGVISRCVRCKEHADDFEMEFRVVHRDGSVRWLYDRGRTFVDPAGRPLYMTGACVDITERRRVQEALRASETFYRRMLESVPGMTFTTRADGSCDYLSEQWASYLGAPVEEFLGHGWTHALHPEDRERAARVFAESLQTLAPYTVEYRLRRHDGAYEWFKAQGHAIPAAGDQGVRWIGTVSNVNNLKDAEAAARARERELRVVTDNLPDIVARFDRDMRHVFINAAIERVTGRPRSDFLGRTSRDAGMPEALCQHWERAVGKVFQDGRDMTLQFDFEHDGVLRHFAARLVPEPSESDELTHVLVVTRDVTEFWQAQEALRRADRQKDDFLATLAHELRNPLAPLRTGLAVLQGGADEAAARRTRQIMERQLQHMVRLVDELLDIARISQGKVVLRREVLPIDDVLQHAVDASRPLLDAQGHAFTWEGSDPALHVHGDMTRLAQVVGNLLNNAAKYTPPGGRVAMRVEPDGPDLRIVVEDSGVGIPRDMLGRIFERFVQAEEHLERSQGGLGIGLSVVRSLVEMHGGRVAADSGGPGTGSRFVVWLPRAQAAAPAAAAGRPATTAAAPPQRKVLIVDDNVDAAETLAMVAGLQGHETRLAHDGPSAVRVAGEFRPDLVFLDIGLPGMDGYKVARALRAIPGWHGLLVALTGWGTEEDRARSLAAGFSVHLTKPVDLEAVERLLDGDARQP